MLTGSPSLALDAVIAVRAKVKIARDLLNSDDMRVFPVVVVARG